MACDIALAWSYECNAPCPQCERDPNWVTVELHQNQRADSGVLLGGKLALTQMMCT